MAPEKTWYPPAQPARVWCLQLGSWGKNTGAEVQLGGDQGLRLGAGVEGTDIMDVKGGAACRVWQGTRCGEQRTLGGQMFWGRSRHCLSDLVRHIVWSPSAEPGVGAQRWEIFCFQFYVFCVLALGICWTGANQVCDLTDES